MMKKVTNDEEITVPLGTVLLCLSPLSHGMQLVDYWLRTTVC